MNTKQVNILAIENIVKNNADDVIDGDYICDIITKNDKAVVEGNYEIRLVTLSDEGLYVSGDLNESGFSFKRERIYNLQPETIEAILEALLLKINKGKMETIVKEGVMSLIKHAQVTIEELAVKLLNKDNAWENHYMNSDNYTSAIVAAACQYVAENYVGDYYTIQEETKSNLNYLYDNDNN